MGRLHVFRVLFVFILIIVIVIFIFLLLVLSLLGVVFLLFLALFDFAQLLPLLCEAVCLGFVVSDDNVVKDGATFNLPQIKANESEVGILVYAVIILVLWIGNLLCLPEALVRWVGDSFCDPLTLELGIVLHRRLPLTILLIVPVVRLLRLTINNSLLLHPVIWLLRLWVVNHRIIHPIVWLLVIWVGNLLWFQDLPILLHGPFIDLLLVDVHADSVIWLQSQAIHMGCTLTLLLVGKV